MPRDNETLPLTTRHTKSVPAKFKVASFTLNTSAWTVIIGSLAIVVANIINSIYPLSELAFYGLILLSAGLVGLPLGVHDYRNAVSEANTKIEEQNEVENELSELKKSLQSLPAIAINNHKSKRVTQLTATQVFLASSAAIGGIFFTLGSKIKTYTLPTTEITAPTLIAILIPGAGITLLLAYGFRQCDVIVKKWQEDTEKSIEFTQETINQIYRSANTLFQPATPSGNTVSISMEPVQANLSDHLNINSSH